MAALRPDPNVSSWRCLANYADLQIGGAGFVAVFCFGLKQGLSPPRIPGLKIIALSDRSSDQPEALTPTMTAVIQYNDICHCVGAGLEMIRSLSWLVAAALFPTVSLAQSAASSDKGAVAREAKPVDAVIITAPQQQDRVEIDRRSYSVSKNLQAQSGTLADLLRTIPAVEVDAQGAVSLRGDQAVTIMVDGKPSSLFRGGARAAAIQGLPADQYERVEVITNPSAAESPEGTAGIINLISKRARKAGVTGSIKLGGGDKGQRNVSINGAYNAAKTSLSADLSVRQHDPQSGRFVEDRTSPLTATTSRTSRQITDFDGRIRSLVGRLGADYDLDTRTHLGVQILAVVVQLDETSDALTTTQDHGAASGAFERQVDRRFHATNREASGSFRRKLGDDQELTGEASINRMAIRSRARGLTLSTLPPGPSVFSDQFTPETNNRKTFKADYKNPFSGGELKLGYEGRVTRNDMAYVYGEASTRATIAADPARSGAFAYRLKLNAGYATLQKKLGEFTLLAGLRLEDSHTTIAGAGIRHEMNLLRPFPSLHLSYPLSEETKLSASYSRRIERPTPSQLSPLVSYGDRLYLSSGNPELRPQETDAFELAYDTRKGASSISATIFYRELHNAIAQVVRDQGDGVLLFTQDNLGNVRRAGLALVGKRPLGSKISLNLSGEAYWTELPVSALGFGEVRSGYVVSGRGSLSWTPTTGDFFQIDGRLSGKKITPQGSIQPIGVISLGYRRKLSPSLFVNATLQDVLNSNRQKLNYASPTMNYRRTVDGVGRMAALTLTYNFGGGTKKPRDPSFDFSGSAPPSDPR